MVYNHAKSIFISHEAHDGKVLGIIQLISKD